MEGKDGERRARLGDPLLSLAAQSPAHPANKVFDTLCEGMRQDTAGSGARVSLAATGAMSEVSGVTGLGARVRRSLL